MRLISLLVTGFLAVGLGLLTGVPARCAAQEPQKQPSLNEDREALCGDGKTVGRFGKRDPMARIVQLGFSKGKDGKPDSCVLYLRPAAVAIAGSTLAFTFEFKLEDK